MERMLVSHQHELAATRTSMAQQTQAALETQNDTLQGLRQEVARLTDLLHRERVETVELADGMDAEITARVNQKYSKLVRSELAPRSSTIGATIARRNPEITQATEKKEGRPAASVLRPQNTQTIC